MALLEHVSQEVGRRENLPTHDQVKAMGDDLDFKGNQLERAKNTQDQLQAELKKRKEELAKVESLDSKIAVELSSLKEKMRTMTDEMAVFRDLDMLKRNSEVTKEALQQMREDYKKRKDAIKAQAQAAALEFDRVKAQLASNETHKKLDELERRLQQHEQSIFSTRECKQLKDEGMRIGGGGSRGFLVDTHVVHDTLTAHLVQLPRPSNTPRIPIVTLLCLDVRVCI